MADPDTNITNPQNTYTYTYSYSIGIIGIGVLGTAIKETFETFEKLQNNQTSQNILSTISSIISYDKYKGIGTSILDMCKCDIIFLCLPTEYDNDKKEYDKSEIEHVFSDLAMYEYKGIIILKSTVEPQTTSSIYKHYKYAGLQIIHSPEFLTARTATDDFMNQKHIVLGFPEPHTHTDTQTHTHNTITYLTKFFSIYFPDAKISICSSDESESMKMFCNSFYATKIQFFTEMKLLCDKLNIDYNNVKDLMISNGWINPYHTQIPGHDGKLSFGGKCFPKDIKALSEVFKKMEISNEVLEAVIRENKMMRDDV